MLNTLSNERQFCANVGSDDPSRKAAKTPEAAKAQIVQGYKELGDLLSNYEKVP